MSTPGASGDKSEQFIREEFNRLLKRGRKHLVLEEILRWNAKNATIPVDMCHVGVLWALDRYTPLLVPRFRRPPRHSLPPLSHNHAEITMARSPLKTSLHYQTFVENAVDGISHSNTLPNCKACVPCTCGMPFRGQMAKNSLSIGMLLLLLLLVML